jgi:hypothetical protein
MGFFRQEKLNEEAHEYGAVGGRPQVVWPNGVLASTAIGIVIAILTGWSEHLDHCRYLAYDGNSGALVPHIRWQHLENRDHCEHFPLSAMGDAIFVPIDE